MQILLLEPDHALAAIYQDALQAAGHEVRHVAHAQDAIHAVDSKIPEMIIMELHLVNHGGIEFLHELRSYPEWQGIPVVVLSMVSPRRLATHKPSLRELGVTECLYKPDTSLERLVHVVAHQP